MGFVGKLVPFPVVKEFWNYVKNWQIYTKSLVYYFLGDSVVLFYWATEWHGSHSKVWPL